MTGHDLISKTALLKHLDMAIDCKECPRNANKELYKCVHNPTSERCTCFDIAQICIRITEFALSTDVQPVKCGRWLTKFDGDIYEYYECSECGNTGSCETTYCSNCGARMDGVENG